MTPRMLPNDVEAEGSLLGCCLIDDGATLNHCTEAKIVPETFYDPKHGIVFERLLDLAARQVEISVTTLGQDLRTSKLIETVGGFAFLVQITDRTPTTAQAPYFIETVVRLHKQRQLIREAEALAEAAYSATLDLDFASQHVNRMSEILTSSESTRTWAQAVDEAEALTRERMKPPAERNTHGLELSWGLSDFDRFFGPVEMGELVVIGGYTSSGKSSLLRQVMWAIAKQGHPAFVETIEVRDTEEAINLAAHIARHRSRARLDQMHARDQQQLLDAFQTMRVPHFAVCDQDHDLASMIGRARAFKRRHGLKAFGADYLQIMRDVKQLRHGERPDFAIGCVTSEFKRFATRENCATFLLSGFNRNYVRDGNREPRLSDLDGSASIEKDASRVILLDVPTEYVSRGVKYQQNLTADASEVPTFYVKAIQAKGRNQGTACVGLLFKRETKTFELIA